MNIKLGCIFFLLFAKSLSASGSNSIEQLQEVKKIVSNFLHSVEIKDYAKVGDYFSNDGVIDSDTRIDFDNIRGDIYNENSYIHQSLFRKPSHKDIELCITKLQNKFSVSLYSFLEKYRGNYQIQISENDLFSGYYDIYLKPDHIGKTHGQCKFETPIFTVRYAGGKIGISHYSF